MDMADENDDIDFELGEPLDEALPEAEDAPPMDMAGEDDDIDLELDEPVTRPCPRLKIHPDGPGRRRRRYRLGTG